MIHKEKFFCEYQCACGKKHIETFEKEEDILEKIIRHKSIK